MASPQAQALFADAARAIFSNWTTLTLAVDGQWGGPSSQDKARAMLDYSIRLFRESARVYSDELEDYFDGCFLEDFNTDAEDGSPKQVADLLISVHQACVAGDVAKVSQLVGQKVTSAAQSQRQNESDDDVSGDENDEMMTDVPASLPPSNPPVPKHVVDEDGWETVVTRKGRK